MDPASRSPLFGAVDAVSLDRTNATPPKIGYVTFGNRADPCVVVPPGGGSTKEESFFWSRELASLGPFFVVAYDVRGTGSSNPPAYAESIRKIFADNNTTPVTEMERVLGIVSDEGDDNRGRDQSDRGPLAVITSKKHMPGALNASISGELPDFRAYIEDAFAVLDELGIEKAHFCGLSQGGALSRLAAVARPERVLSCVACAGAAGKLGVMMAAASAGAEAFNDQIKAAKLYTKKGKMSLDGEAELGEVNPSYCEVSGTGTRVWSGQPQRLISRADYVKWRSALLEIIAPGHPTEIYAEMAARGYDVGYLTEEQIAVCCLAYETFERGGWEAEYFEKLKRNGLDGRRAVPIMYVHGKKDPVVHFGELQKLFSVTRNCVKLEHEHGHNFGPGGREQTAILANMARFMKQHGSNTDQGGKSGTGGEEERSGDAQMLRDVTVGCAVPDIYDAFCLAQTAAGTVHCLGVLLEKLQLKHLREGSAPPGLQLFLSLQSALKEHGLNFRQKKLLRDLEESVTRTQKVVGRARYGQVADAKKVLEETVLMSGPQAKNNDVLVCGAGPVGLRTAVELALLGFRVRVVEKRPNFSRANILTFWDETMQDMLLLGAKTYFPDLQPTGKQKILGTRQIQTCLLKTLLLLGGEVRHGMEICGLVPPGEASVDSAQKWRARFRPYVRHRRVNEQEKQKPTEQGDDSAGDAGKAVDFQQAKDYGGKETATIEAWDVDHAFISGANITGSVPSVEGESSSKSFAGDGSVLDGGALVPFDVYVIAEGGWSDSTQKLGFHKAVDLFKPTFGLVANLEYDPTDLKEKNMKSQIHFCLGNNWPLTRCPIQAEFVEYLKLESHFFALVVSKKNIVGDRTDTYLERMSEKDRAHMPDELIAEMRRNASQKGLLDMGVFKEDKRSAKELLRRENIDMDKLTETVRLLTQELGLPETTPFCETNGIQLFDFSRRARCIEPVRVLRSDGGGLSKPPAAQRARVLGAAEYMADSRGAGAGGGALSGPGTASEDVATGIDALLLPVGDALQEPIWTQGLGINRGFHTAMNQAYVCLLAREKGLTFAVKEALAVHECVLGMKWGAGHSGLAGSGSGDIGLKPWKQWDTDPRNRLPYK